MTYYVDIQNATEQELPLNDDELTILVELVLREKQKDGELTLRIVNPDEMIYLNNTYRQKNKTTNVLAFPSSLPDGVELECPLLGDIIICPEVLVAESEELKKTLKEHWSLIIIHGVLHLLGYDHIKDEEAEIMQAQEVKLLAKLGYANPYNFEGY